jgi:hypothetical protein
MATALLVGLDQLLRANSWDCYAFRLRPDSRRYRKRFARFPERDRPGNAAFLQEAFSFGMTTSPIQLRGLSIFQSLRDNLLDRPQSADTFVPAG